MKAICLGRILLSLSLLFIAPINAACRQISVLVEFPCNFLTEDFGHVGVGVDDEYYDFGPDQKSGWKLWLLGSGVGVRGGQFYDLAEAVRDPYHETASTSDVRKFLKKGQSCEAYEVRATVTPETARDVEEYWKKIYANFPRFRMLGKQCTSVAYRSLRAGGLLHRNLFISKIPTHFFNRLRRQLYSNCGQQYNQPAEVFTLKSKEESLREIARNKAAEKAKKSAKSQRNSIATSQVKISNEP